MVKSIQIDIYVSIDTYFLTKGQLVFEVLLVFFRYSFYFIFLFIDSFYTSTLRYIADLQIPEACKTFVREYGNEIVQEKLCKNFLLHLVNLNDFNILGKAQLLQTIEMLDEVMHS